MEEITLPALMAARERNLQRRLPGERLRILQQEGNLDHVQIDNLVWECLPDESGPGFFLYDLSWRTFCSGEIDIARIYQLFGIEVADVASLREAMAAIFRRWGPCAVAVKSQHAYDRTLLWQERADADANRVLQKSLAGQTITPEEKLCLGDWCLSRGVELAIQHNLPFKLHTGYYCRINRLFIDRIRPGHLCTLLMRYPKARFVLMHAGYPNMDEMLVLAKHFPNVYVDMCWTWSIDPLAASHFVRRMIHTVPTNKLFVFGGDTLWPNAAVAYARQAREWLTRALQAAIDERELTEREAITLASRFMHLNQRDCFDLEHTRAAIHAAMN
jgi:predicted TIM-barrel fold metal-dependent hydrolase